MANQCLQQDLVERFYREASQHLEEGGRWAFIRAALNGVRSVTEVESVSFFEYDSRLRLLILRLRSDKYITCEQDGAVKLTRGSHAEKAMSTMHSVKATLASGKYLYFPFSFDNFFSGSSDKQNSGACLIVLKRKPSAQGFSTSETIKIGWYLRAFMRFYYKAEYMALAQTHDSDIASITKVTEIFATALRSNDSFKRILMAIQTHFAFDRVRLYIVREKEHILQGELSVDIAGNVIDISQEKIPLEKGMHRFADILLGKDCGDFLECFKDRVMYLPLRIREKSGSMTNVGMLVVDNFLSQRSIEPREQTMIYYFGGHIALAVDNIRLFNKVEDLSLYDVLIPKMPNRRYFESKFEEEFYRAKRFNQSLSLIWIDLDEFKHINDEYGHLTGDEALKALGKIMLENMRQADFPCRFGGDEMLILLPHASGDMAMALAQRLKKQIAKVRVPVINPDSKAKDSKTVSFSLSIGIATFPEDAENMGELKKHADEALYWVKTNGRDNIMRYSCMTKKAGRKKADAV